MLHARKVWGRLAFAIVLCQRQASAGRKYVLEHPARATSWSTQAMAQLLRGLDCYKVEFDFCMAGMMPWDILGQAPAKKRTGIATNSKALATTLANLQCDGSHRHVILMGGKAKQCEKYPEDFCRLVCSTIMDEKFKVHKCGKLRPICDSLFISFGNF